MKLKTRIFCIIALILLVLSSCASLPSDTEHMTVYYFNVGQGDAALAVLDGMTVLFDTGTSESEEKLIAYLERLGVEKLDLLVLSHPHEDHIGGADRVIERFGVESVLMTSADSTDRAYFDLLDAIDAADATVTEATAGVSLTVGDMTLDVLSPDELSGDSNSDSAVVKLTFGETSFLFTGDLDGEAEAKLTNTAGKSLTADVLKVSHHGSNTATSAEFLDAVAPSVAVISCGEDNDYGHPHSDVISRLTERGIAIGRTDEGRTVTVASDGKTVEIKE